MSPSRILQSVTARRSMERLALAVLGATILFVPIAWASFDDGLQAAKNGDYEKAMELYRAADGDLRALTNLGWHYAKGVGVEEDCERAAELYREAAEQGFRLAQYNLGLAYRRGKGVEHDEEQAQRWFLLAADSGHLKAQYNVGQSYLRGIGTKRSYFESVKWFRRAAEKRISPRAIPARSSLP